MITKLTLSQSLSKNSICVDSFSPPNNPGSSAKIVSILEMRKCGLKGYTSGRTHL